MAMMNDQMNVQSAVLGMLSLSQGAAFQQQNFNSGGLAETAFLGNSDILAAAPTFRPGGSIAKTLCQPAEKELHGLPLTPPGSPPNEEKKPTERSELYSGVKPFLTTEGQFINGDITPAANTGFLQTQQNYNHATSNLAEAINLVKQGQKNTDLCGFGASTAGLAELPSTALPGCQNGASLATSTSSFSSFPEASQLLDNPTLAKALQSTSQMRRPRGEKKPIPQDQKDEKYFERRKRNNVAAKRSRDTRKVREDDIAIRAAYLERENAVLRAQVSTLREEAQNLRTLVLQKRQRQMQMCAVQGMGM